MKTKLFYLLLFICSISYSQIPTNGLIAKYDLDNSNLTDSSTGAINFTQAGTLGVASNDRFNTSNTAYNLNNDYLTRSDLDYNVNHGNLNNGVDNTVSYAFWIKTDEVSSERKTIIDDSERSGAEYAGKEAGYFIHLTNGKIGVASRVEYNNNQFNQASTAVAALGITYSEAIADGNWHHVIVKLGQYYSGSSSGRYFLRSSISVDGGAIETAVQNFDVKFYITKYTNTVGNVVIGNNRAENLLDANRYNDEIDDILVYNRALTTAERTAIFTNGGATCTAPLSSSYNILVTENLTEANVSILDADTYDVAYVESGNAFSTATILNGLTTGDNLISGLNTGTSYDIYLRRSCGSGNTSGWTIANNFKTDTVVYVNHSATGNNDGSTWANAYVNLYDALSSNLRSDQKIWVATGTYKPNATLGRESTFLLENPISIYGGFNGTETNLGNRDITTNTTILSGDLNSDDNATITDAEPTRQDNSYHVITLKGNFGTAKPVIDGFTITGGNANGSADIACSTAAVNQYIHYRAAAIYVNPDAANAEINVAIKNCIIENNSATGMAVYITVSPCGITGTTTDVDFEKSIIRNNYSITHANIYYNGSGTYNNDRNGSLINCLAYANHSTDDSSVLALTTSGGASSSTVLIYNTTMSKNTSRRFRGGVLTPSVIRTNNASNSIIANSIIYDNGGNYPIDNSSGATIVYKYNSIIQAQTASSTNVNPQFTDSANFDFTLQSTSPAVDTGNNTYANTETDLLGNSRIFNTTVDIGAYEYGSTPPVDRTLTITAINGTVTTNPNPTNGTYDDGAVVALTATPATGYQFDGWSGDTSGNSNPLSLTMDADKMVTAIFSPIQHTLTLNSTNGNVTASPSSVNGTYSQGTVVTLTPNPDANYEFSNWGGDISGAGNTNLSATITITMDTDKDITAYFGIIYYELSITANTQGSVTPSTPDRGSVDYISGSNVTLTATPNTGYEFESWSGDVVGTTNPISFTMDADKSVTPVYKPIKYTITIGNNYYGDNSTGSMTISPSSPNNEYDYGTVVTFTATPAAGYEFEIFAFNGGAVATNPLNHTVTGDLTINPGFTKIQRVLTINATNGTVTMNPNPTNGTYDDGKVIVLTATPSTGYQFDGWSGDATGNSNPLSLTMDADKTITAMFSQIQHVLTINIIGAGTVDVATGTTYNYGDVVTLTAAPGANQAVKEWTGDVTAGAVNSVQVTMDANKTVSVEFESTLSINDVDRIQGLKMYPNPTRGDVTIDLIGEIKSIKLYNLQGQVVKTFFVNKIDISKVSKGIYLLKITTKSGKIAINKIMKK